MLLSAEKGGDVVDSYGVVTAGGVGDGASSVGEGLKMLKGAKNFLDAFAFNISQHRNFQRELDGLTSMVAY
jgi:catalase